LELVELTATVGPQAARGTLAEFRPAMAVFRYRTDRRVTVPHTISNLENPAIIAFVNAIDDERRIHFFQRFGLLTS
jgi:hypothetical protein